MAPSSFDSSPSSSYVFNVFQFSFLNLLHFCHLLFYTFIIYFPFVVVVVLLLLLLASLHADLPLQYLQNTSKSPQPPNPVKQAPAEEPAGVCVCVCVCVSTYIYTHWRESLSRWGFKGSNARIFSKWAAQLSHVCCLKFEILFWFVRSTPTTYTGMHLLFLLLLEQPQKEWQKPRPIFPLFQGPFREPLQKQNPSRYFKGFWRTKAFPDAEHWENSGEYAEIQWSFVARLTQSQWESLADLGAEVMAVVVAFTAYKKSCQVRAGDKFESLGGSQAPPSFWKVQGLPRKFPGDFPRGSPATSPEVSRCGT